MSEKLEKIKQGYVAKIRTLNSIRPIATHLEKFGLPSLDYSNESTIYGGLEHSKRPKLPNITYLPDLELANLGTSCETKTLFGSTFGHQHLQQQRGDNRPFQEIYEFQSYGAMLLRNNGTNKIVLARPGDKIIIKTNDSMTLFNLDSVYLKTLDYANPQMNSATKQLEETIGPQLMIQTDSEGTTFLINPDYQILGLNNGTENSLNIPTLNKDEELFELMIKKRKDFLKIGLELVFGGNIPRELQKEFSKPLEKLIANENNFLSRALKI